MATGPNERAARTTPPTRRQAARLLAQPSCGATLADVGQVLASGFDAGNPLAAQLRMVARMIASRAALGMKRQVFMVMLGGFDTHSNLADVHPDLLARLAAALVSFDRAIDELGVADQVTTFTASDFGRTMTSNGDGSDHGWGSVHLVSGGAVRGGRFYGRAPERGHRQGSPARPAFYNRRSGTARRATAVIRSGDSCDALR